MTQSEREAIVKEVKHWLKSHYPDEEASWHIQNLLGNILGWGTPEQEEVSKLLTHTQGVQQ